jgi:hypothetical protein
MRQLLDHGGALVNYACLARVLADLLGKSGEARSEREGAVPGEILAGNYWNGSQNQSEGDHCISDCSHTSISFERLRWKRMQAGWEFAE